MVAAVLQPTAQWPQTVGTCCVSHGRPRKRYVVDVSAPTGQSSMTLPENSPSYGRSSNVVITEWAPRFSVTSCRSSETFSEKRVQR